MTAHMGFDRAATHHQALQAVRDLIHRLNVGWILDVVYSTIFRHVGQDNLFRPAPRSGQRRRARPLVETMVPRGYS